MSRAFKARITYDKSGKAKVVIPLPVINALDRPDTIDVVLEDNQLKYIAREQTTTKHDLNKASQHDIKRFLSELGKIEHEIGQDRTKIKCFTRRDVQQLLEAHGIYLHLKSVERGLNALIAKGKVTKFFESQGRTTLYRVKGEIN